MKRAPALAIWPGERLKTQGTLNMFVQDMFAFKIFIVSVFLHQAPGRLFIT